MKGRYARIGMVTCIIAALLVLDRLAKWVALEKLRHAPAISLWHDLVRFEYAENPGAFLSLGASLPEGARFLIMVVLVSIALAATLIYTFVSEDLARPRLVALSLMTGGGIGNLIDRVARGGHVIDFVSMGIGSLRTGIFNVADLGITTGVLLFVLGPMFRPRRGDAPEAIVPDDAEPSTEATNPREAP